MDLIFAVCFDMKDAEMNNWMEGRMMEYLSLRGWHSVFIEFELLRIRT